MERKSKSLTLGVGGAILMLGASLLAPLAAHAGADGRKNTAIALGAAAAYELLLKHQTGAGLVLGAGAAYAGKRYEDARRQESQNRDRSYYRNGSSNGYNNNGYYDNNGNYHSNNNNYNNGYNNNSYDPNNYDNQNYQYQGQNSDREDYNDNKEYKHGKKHGWNGRNLPPGQYKKHHEDDNDN